MLTAPMHYTPPQKTGKLSVTELAEFLHQSWNARLATVTPEGRPYLTPLWYAYQPELNLFYLVARARATFVAHLRNNSAVALHIADDVHMEHTRVLIEGVAQVATEAIAPANDPMLRNLVNDMAARYMGPDGPSYAAKTMDRPRLLISITPEKVVSWTGGEWAAHYWQ